MSRTRKAQAQVKRAARHAASKAARPARQHAKEQARKAAAPDTRTRRAFQTGKHAKSGRKVERAGNYAGKAMRRAAKKVRAR